MKSDTPRFRGRPVGKQRTRRFMLSVGAAGVAVLMVMLYLSFNVANRVPGRSYYDVYAEFNEADNLANHYEVRIGGRRAGQVLKPEVRNGRARVHLRLSKEFGPLRSDTKTRVRLRSAVGVRYLEITPGTRGRFLSKDETIPAANQQTSVPLDAVLGTFDPNTRKGLQSFLANLGGAFAGNGIKINNALGSAPQFFSDLGSLSKAITDRPQAMRRLINGTGRTLAAFDGVRDEIASGFRVNADAAHAFAATRPEFGATLREAPPALTVLRAQLPSVRALVNEVGGLAREGKPTLDLAPNALTRTNRLMVDAQPALNDADRTLNLVRKASPPTVKLLQTLRPELPDVSTLADSFQPTVKYLAPRQCEIINFTTGWGPTLKWRLDGQGQLNFFISLNQRENSFLSGITSGTDLNFAKTSPYPGPCVGNSGESGAQNATVEEQAMGFKYGFKNPPNLGDKFVTSANSLSGGSK